MGQRGPKPGSGGRPKKPIAEKIAAGNPGKRKLKVQIVRDKKADGYQLQYSTKKKFKKKTTKTININKNKKTTKILKKLKSGKKYYIRVRSFKKIRSNNSVTKVYGSWSDVMVSKKIK